jgi:hypothetical protein
MKITKDKVLHLIKSADERFPANKPKGVISNNTMWTNVAWNLGDTLNLSIIPKKAHDHNREMNIFSQSAYFPLVMGFIDNFKGIADYDPLHYLNIMNFEPYDYGGGHWLQIQCRALGFEIDLEPKPYLNYQSDKKQKSVLINLEGHFYNYLTQEITPLIQEFVDKYKNEYHFVECFAKQHTPYLRDVEYFHVEVDEFIRRTSTFEYFIGLNSGPAHVVAAFDVKGVIIVPDVPIDRFYLPKPNCNNTAFVHMDYLYPQNVHLHVHDENELVKKLSVENLKRALDGELYPYWQENFLDIVLEF